MGQSCPAQTLVAQVSNLLYRGFPIRRRRETPVSHRSPAVSRLEVGDTADWKSALQPGETDPLHERSDNFGIDFFRLPEQSTLHATGDNQRLTRDVTRQCI